MSKSGSGIANPSNSKINQGVLNSEPAFQQVIDRLRNYIVGYNSDGLPRFGILSIIAKRTPFFAYDHPQLRKMADTAFTDFHHCFFSNSFTKELLMMDQSAKENNRVESNLLFVGLHELSHIAKFHNMRMTQFDPQLANIAGDVRINMDLLKFDDMYISQKLMEESWGCSEEETQKWDGQSEEVIAYHILSDAKKQQKDKQQEQGNDGQGSGDQGQGGKPQQSKQEKIQDLIDQLKNGEELHVQIGGDTANPDENHMIDIKDVIKACEEAGLTDVLDKLKLPSSSDVGKLADLANQVVQNITNDSAELDMIRNESFNGKRMPGEHINFAVSELVTDISKPKLSWKTAIKKITQGDGLEYMYTDEVQHDLCYVAASDMGIPDELYLGVEIPHKQQKGTIINIMDTSGSVTFEELKDYCAEIFGQIDSANQDEGASEVIFMSADTVQRGEIVTLTRENYEDFIHEISIYGRGGTSFAGPINSAFDWAKENNKKIDGLVYWTDLGASTPARGSLPDELPPIIFMTHTKHLNSSFANEVKGFAEVYAIDEGLTLDFEELADTIPAAISDYTTPSM
jgi:hypothetical protein